MSGYFYHRFRLDSYGSPFRNVNSGINWWEDKENVRRYDVGLNLYLQEYKSKIF